MIFRLDLRKCDRRKWQEVWIDFKPDKEKFTVQYLHTTKRGMAKFSEKTELSWNLDRDNTDKSKETK